MARRDEILAYADELLDVASFPEFAPAGVQVLGAEEVDAIACGVTVAACLCLISIVRQIAKAQDSQFDIAAF